MELRYPVFRVPIHSLSDLVHHSNAVMVLSEIETHGCVECSNSRVVLSTSGQGGSISRRSLGAGGSARAYGHDGTGSELCTGMIISLDKLLHNASPCVAVSSRGRSAFALSPACTSLSPLVAVVYNLLLSLYCELIRVLLGSGVRFGRMSRGSEKVPSPEPDPVSAGGSAGGSMGRRWGKGDSSSASAASVPSATQSSGVPIPSP